MKKKKRTIAGKVCLVMLFFFICGKTLAQISKPITCVLSPNATSISQYGDIPVSLYTGTPNIEIPLYTEKIKGFELPISLRYHASGIRPDQRAGWVGLGWTLNAGGVISRKVNDMPDEFHFPSIGLPYAGYLWNYARVMRDHGENDNITRDNLRSMAQGIVSELDTSPDEFSFSFGKYSGKFYLIGGERVRIQCQYPVSVKLNYDENSFFEIPFNKEGTLADRYGYPKILRGFTITTEDGTQYVFGEDINAIDFSIDFFSQVNDIWTATSWYLTKVILPSTHEISLKYERGDFVSQMYLSVYHSLGTKVETNAGILIPSFGCDIPISSGSMENSIQGQLISPVYLKEITSNNCIILFERSISNELNYDVMKVYYTKYNIWYNSDQAYPFLPILKSSPKQDGWPNCLNNLKWYKLDKIVIKPNNHYNITKTIEFTYNNKPRERLVLNEIKGTDNGIYKFFYNNAAGLPPYLANKNDHWGFYNNTYATVDLNNCDAYYNLRAPNAAYMEFGTLYKIQYPTGGYTEFVFEPHYYRKQTKLRRWDGVDNLVVNQMAGGLRIKQIKNSSTSTDPAKVVKEFFYVSDYLQKGVSATVSSGVLGGQVQYYFKDYDYVVYAFNDDRVKRSMNIFSSNSVLPSCHNANGSHIGYTEVIEKNADNSFTRHQFTNFDNGYLDKAPNAIIQESHSPYESYNSKDMERGLLLLKEDYNSNKKKIKSITTSYVKDESSHRNVNMIECKWTYMCPPRLEPSDIKYDEGVFYKIGTYTMLPSAVTETYYDPDNESAMQSITTTYIYPKTDYEAFPIPTNLVSEIRVMNSNGRETVTQFMYPYTDPRASTGFLNANAGYKDMAINHKSMQPIIQKTVTTGDAKTTEYFDFTKTKNVYHLKTYRLQYGDDDIREIDRYEVVDSYGNPIHVIHKGTENTVYLWGYSGQFLIAEMKDAVYGKVRSILNVDLESFSTAPSYQHGLLRDKMHNTTILYSEFVYVPSRGLVQVSNPQYLHNHYTYDAYGRLEYKSVSSGYGVYNTTRKIEEYEYNYAH